MKPRLESLDVFRGATVAAMLLVNNPGNWGAVWWPLDHAAWHGWTPTDLIFPFFLFVVGITTELAPKEPRRIVRRAALIVLFGLFLNAFPFFDLGELRLLGVLQRIGIVYGVSACIARFASRRSIAILIAVILLGYWFLLTRGPLQPAEATIAARVDRLLLRSHTWRGGGWDPEGPLSTIPAVATTLAGVLAAPYVLRRDLRLLAAAGAAAVLAGLAWGRVFPINKNLWTSSYVVLTAGFAALILALCIWLVEVHRIRRPFQPFVAFGVNPMLAFLGSGILARLLLLIRIDGVTLHTITYRWIKPYFEPHVASCLWGIAFVLVWLAILWPLCRRGIVLKV